MTELTAREIIAKRAAADAIYAWLERDCDVDDDEQWRALVEAEDRYPNILFPTVEA